MDDSRISQETRCSGEEGMTISYEELKKAFPEEAKKAEEQSKAFAKKLIAAFWELYKEEFGIE